MNDRHKLEGMLALSQRSGLYSVSLQVGVSNYGVRAKLGHTFYVKTIKKDPQCVLSTLTQTHLGIYSLPY